MRIVAFQKEVYDKTCRVLINDVINGFNATVFAYGATGQWEWAEILQIKQDMMNSAAVMLQKNQSPRLVIFKKRKDKDIFISNIRRVVSILVYS